MAVVETNNSQILTFDNKGRLLVTPAGGASDYRVANIVGGTAKITIGLRQPMDPDIDNGDLLADVRAGNATPSYLELDIKYTSEIDAASMLAMLMTEETDGLMPKFTLVLEHWHGSDNSAGIEWTFADAVRADPNIEISAGQQHDTMKVRFMATATPTPADLAA